MPRSNAPAAPPGPLTPADPQSARTRLMLAALQLFAAQGYAKTSIRAIASAAQANVAAVSYYFGDKAALYSALFSEPFGDIHSLIPDFTRPEMTLREALHSYFHGALTALHHGEIARQVVRLHIREMLEPTSQWEHELEKDVRQPHHAMVGLLCRHMNVAEPDDDMHRLVLTITGLAFQLWGHQEVIIAIQPQLLATSEAVDVWVNRMTDYALAMVAVEQRLRAAPAPHPADPTPQRTPRRRAKVPTDPAPDARAPAAPAARRRKNRPSP